MRVSALFMTVSCLLLALPSQAHAQAAPPTLADLPNLTAIGIEAAREAGLTGKGVTVGILDKAVDTSHPEFAGRILGTYDYTTGGPVEFTPTNPHGTHVLGTLAGQNVGVAPGASILSIAIAESSVEDLETEAEVQIPSALRWAIDGGAQVINFSWGYQFDVTDLIPGEYPVGLLRAFRDTADAGVVTVWANGNEEWGNPAMTAGAPFHFPELQPTWIAVAALAGDGTIAPYSNRCGVAAQWCISAPGGDSEKGILSSVIGGGYQSSYAGETWQGTSMATPHVTGAVAIAMEMFPNADPRDIVQLVLRSAVDIGDPGVDNVYGWGSLSLANIVAAGAPETASVFANAAWSRFSALDAVNAALRQRANGLSLASGAEDAGTAAWLLPLAGLARIDNGPASAAATSRSAGFLAGVDIIENAQWRVGIGAGHSRTALDESGRSDNAETSALHGVAYALYQDGPWFSQMTGQVASFRQEVERRSISGTLGAFEQPAGSAEIDGVAAGGDLRFGMEVYSQERRSIAGYVATSAMVQRTDGFEEEGAGVFGLTGDKDTLSQYAAGIGLRWTEDIPREESAPVEIVTDVALLRRFGDLDHASSISLLGSGVAASTDKLSENILRISGRAVMPLQLGEAYLGYDATLPDASLSLSLGLNMRF
jgi:subtilase-type serine protease